MIAPAHELWVADRKQPLRTKLDDVEPRPIAISMTDGEIHILAGKIDLSIGHRNPKMDFRLRIGKAPEPIDEPFGREIR
jgi:hypothetical protein